jgi:hypothetical protein
MEIQVREHGRHVVVLTIDNEPRLNAMSRPMMADLARLWDELDRGSCRCVVLTGAGPRAFCAGADMSGDLSAAPETARVVSAALLKHHVFSKPIVAAVNGDCVGGGSSSCSRPTCAPRRRTRASGCRRCAPLGETTEKGLYVDPSATFSQAYHPSSRGPFEKRAPMRSPVAGDGHGTPSPAPASLELQ